MEYISTSEYMFLVLKFTQCSLRCTSLGERNMLGLMVYLQDILTRDVLGLSIKTLFIFRVTVLYYNDMQ